MKQYADYQQQGHQQSYNVYPETPMNHRQGLVDSWGQYYGKSHNHSHHLHHLGVTSQTPRGPYGNYHGQNQRPHQGPYTTSGIDKCFQWKQSGKSHQQNNMKPPSTPTAIPTYINQQNQNQLQNQVQKSKAKTSGDIPNMGYVYIGSRMSQLISHIGLSDREVEENQNRIKASITDILKSEKNFAGFDVVE